MADQKTIMLAGFPADHSLKSIAQHLQNMGYAIPSMILCRTLETKGPFHFEGANVFYESDLYNPHSKMLADLVVDFKELDAFRDKHAFLLRCMGRWESTFTNVDDRIYLIDKIYTFFVKILKESAIDCVVYCTGSPHHFYDLILYLAADSLGIKNLFQLCNPITNRVRFVYNLEYDTLDIKGVGHDNNKMREYLDAVLNQKEISADWRTQALKDPTKTSLLHFSLKKLPRYLGRAVKNVLHPERSLYIYANETKGINIFKTLSFMIRSLINVSRTKRLYQKLKTDTVADKSLIMYSHFQPEATSHPDGGYFPDMRYWYSYLKNKHKKVYYKEHVANFLFHDSFEMTNSLSHRSLAYYLDLHNQGASLLNVYYSTRKLFNQGCSIFTFSGTVIMEAVVNGIEVTFPGNPWFGTLPNSEIVINDRGLKLKVIKKGSIDELDAYFKKQDQSSFPNIFGWNTAVKDESIALKEYCEFIHLGILKLLEQKRGG